MNTQTLVRPNGINHLALATADMKGVLTFFNEVLGMPLVALYWMHGADKVIHGFLRLNESSLLAFVYTPDNPKTVDIGLTHAGNPLAKCAMGTMQHLAFNVDSVDDLLTLRDRIRSKGIHCMGPLDHSFAQSLYFAGPEGMTLEICTLVGSDMSKWVDPEVVELLNISDEELHKLRNPSPFESPAEPVPQPSIEQAEAYKMVFPDGTYDSIMSASDEDVALIFKEEWEPPNA